MLHIEIKSENDIDSEKTETLEKVYEKCFELCNEKPMFQKPVVIATFKVSADGKFINTVFITKVGLTKS